MKWIEKIKWPLRERKIKQLSRLLTSTDAYFQQFLGVENWKSMKQIGETQAERFREIAANTSTSITEIRETHDVLEAFASRVDDGVHFRQKLVRMRRKLLRLKSTKGSGSRFISLLNSSRVSFEWFNPFDCTVKHETTLRQRQEQTCDWLFHVQQFIDWRSSPSQFIWLNGKPGAGKSVLAEAHSTSAAVIEELSGSLQGGENVAYFYCDFRNSRCTSAKEVIYSLVVQLLRSASGNWLSVFPELKERMDRGADPPRSTRYSFRSPHSRFRDCISDLMIVIDALDECSDLADLLDVLVKLNNARIRLFVTSRTELIIKEKFTGLPSISLKDMVHDMENDMRLHVKRQLEARRKLKTLPSSVKDEILELLLRRADGMFRWVQCQLDRLNDCRTDGDIRTVLDTLPTGLFETYERILSAIEEKEFDGAVASRALMWLVAALEPLTLSQLGEALKLELGRPTLNNDIAPMHDIDILDICGSLLSYDEKSGIVFLSHYSVQASEYLSSSPPLSKSLDKYFIRPSVANHQLASISIHCLIFHDTIYPPTNSHESRRPRLLDYALESGFLHIKHIGEEDESILPLLFELQDQVSINPAKYADVVSPSQSNAECWWLTTIPALVLHLIIRFGSPWLLGQYLDRHQLEVIERHNALTYAAQFGELHHATMLLDKDLDINKEGTFVDFRRLVSCLPLTAAAMAHRREHKGTLITLFLERGSSLPSDIIHVVLKSTFWMTDTASIIQTLMDHEADPNVLQHGGSALHSALSSSLCSYSYGDCNCATIVPMLVEAGCNAQALNDDRKSPIHLAARNEHVPALQFFVNIKAALPKDIIHDAVRASDSSRRAVIKLLMDAGGDASAITETGDSPLHTLLSTTRGCDPALSDCTCLEDAQLFIGAGCKWDVTNGAGQTPMYLAIRYGHLSVLRFFMDDGARLPADIVHATVRNDGCRGSRLGPEMLRFILDSGADARVLAGTGDSALHILFRDHCWSSSDCNCGELAQILMEAGCSCGAVNNAGETPLQLAVQNHPDLSVIHVFADFTFTSAPPLVDIIHAVAQVPKRESERSTTTSHLPQKRGFNSLSRASDSTALHVLLKIRCCDWSECQCAEVAHILVEGGCQIESPDHGEESPLLLAVQNGHYPVVEFLVSEGARVSDEIVHVACRNSPPRAPIVKSLLQNGRENNTFHIHRDGDTPLHTLARTYCWTDCDCLQTAILLVAAGFNPESLGDDGKSAVQIAAESEHTSVVRYLLGLGVEGTPDLIHTVSEHDHSESFTVIQQLLQRGADPSILCPSGNTLLHCVAQSRHAPSHPSYFEKVHSLCPGNFDLDLPNRSGDTVLHLAAQSGNLAVVEYLLDLDCAPPSDVLHSAVVAMVPEALQMVKLLIDRGASVESRNHHGDNLLHSVLKAHVHGSGAWLDVFRHIVALDVCDINALDAFSKAPLHYAVAAKDSLPCVQLLLDKGARIPTDIIHSVVYNPQSDAISTIEMFLQNGVSLDSCSKNGNNILHSLLIHTYSFHADFNLEVTAIWSRLMDGIFIHRTCEGVANILSYQARPRIDRRVFACPGAEVPAGIDSPSSEGGNALHSSLRGGKSVLETNLETTQSLVEQGCDINAQDLDGKTPLHYAARNGDIPVIHFLIRNGAQPPDDILHDAFWSGGHNLHAIVCLLLEHGASITSRKKDGSTVLHTFLRNLYYWSPESKAECLSMARFLIDKGCEVNALDSVGGTPLHLPVQAGYIPMVYLLLDKGAKLYQGIIHSAVKTTQFAAFKAILKILTRKGLEDQTIFLESEGHGLLHALCCERFPEAECIHRAQALRGSGFRLERHVNTESDRGFTPLSVVLNYKEPSPSLVTYLIDLGAKFSHVNYLHLNNLRWARELSWYPDALKAYDGMLARQSINLGDVREVQSSLAHRFSLLPRVVNQILDTAGFWACSSITHQNVEFTYRQSKVSLALPWLSSDASDVKLRRMVISYKLQEGEAYYTYIFTTHWTDSTADRPFIDWGGVSVAPERKEVIPGFLHIDSRNSRLEVTNLIGTAVWDRCDPSKDDGFSLGDLVTGDILCFERDVDYLRKYIEMDLELEFLRIDMYYTVS
ncbi:ankyrin repeat-containing domain protein [Melanogaster broomeanus]|nr:ankyrin repeat-containing domain protein [Melanogaster broomeanus]